jgi:hypothetical protein
MRKNKLLIKSGKTHYLAALFILQKERGIIYGEVKTNNRTAMVTM